VDFAAFEREFGDAVDGVLSRHGLLPNRWILVADVLSDAGSRELVTAASADLRAWDALGMLSYAIERERGAVHHEVAAESGDGDGG